MEIQARQYGRPVVTPTNLSPIFQIITWFLLATIFLAVAFRLLTRVFLVRRVGYDDLLISIAFLFSVAESACFLAQPSLIWGRSLQELAQPISGGLKTQYAANLLFVFSLTFAKLSVPAGLFMLSPVRWHKRFSQALCVLAALWCITSIFALAFQCDARAPWDYVTRSCTRRKAILQYVYIMNIITDAASLALPVVIIAPVRMPLEKRAAVISLFSSRILIIAASIVQLVYLPDSLPSNSPDFTLNSFAYLVTTQIVQAMALVTACLPHLQQFLTSLQSGLLWTDHGTVAAGHKSGYGYGIGQRSDYDRSLAMTKRNGSESVVQGRTANGVDRGTAPHEDTELSVLRMQGASPGAYSHPAHSHGNLSLPNEEGGVVGEHQHYETNIGIAE